MSDLISRQKVIKEIKREVYRHTYIDQIIDIIDDFASVETLSDAEQRIFLRAMSREREICEKTDDEWLNDCKSNISLVSVCDEIERKVKSALWI